MRSISFPVQAFDRVSFCFLFVACVVFFLSLSFSELRAQPRDKCAYPGGTIADSSCDCNYWQSLQSRAWLEAEREIVQYQNLIFKPDSVLEYACFDQFVGVAVNEAGRIFSWNPAWNARTRANMSGALRPVLIESMRSYLSLNYSVNYSVAPSPWTLLGGRHLTQSYPNPHTGYPQGYNCSMMSDMWQAAKCYNFQGRSHDGFFSFEEYKDMPKDVRELWDQCIKDLRWGGEIDQAYEKPQWLQNYRNTFSERAYTFIRDALKPGNCGAPHIPTGIQSEAYRSAGVADAFCTMPGCSWNGTACQ